MELCMRNDEADLFKSVLDKSEGYFEYGCGGSTVYAANNTSAKIHTIDSMQEWIDKIKDVIGDRADILYDRVDVGPTKDYGMPVDRSNASNWPAYSDGIFRCSFIPDTVMIDGRFRVACCLKTIKYFHEKQDELNPTILFHDITRPGFEPAFMFLDTVQKVNELGCFKIKQTLDINEVDELITKHELNPG